MVVYDENICKQNPLQAFLFENATGHILKRGSMHISTDSVLLGQSILPTLYPGDESPPIPYAVKLDCEVTKTTATKKTHLKPHLVTIEKGVVKIVSLR